MNDTLQPTAATLEIGWWRLDGGARETESRGIVVKANEMLEAAAAEMTTDRHDRTQWLYAAVLHGRDGAAFDQSVCIMEPYRKLAMQYPQIKVAAISARAWEISSPVFAHAAHVEDHGRELLSDNWIDLLPNVPVRVEVPKDYSPGSAHFEAVMPAPSKP